MLRQPLSPVLLTRMHAWWRAANYLSIGRVYLLDQPTPAPTASAATAHQTAPARPLGNSAGPQFPFTRSSEPHHPGTGRRNVLFIAGPGHGAPGLIANVWLEGTYSEIYPDVSEDEAGMCRLFRQFSFPGGIPSHASPQTPGSIHEGGELGYSLSHAYGAAFDNPDLVVACVIGDGEAETGPLATSWHGNKFLNPKTDGAVLPILHLNGYKIANPTILARIPDAELEALLSGYGHAPIFVEGDEPEVMHQKMAAAFNQAFTDIAAIQQRARTGDTADRPLWPMIVLRTPKGWTGPKTVDGLKTEGFWRSHQVPFTLEKPEHLGLLEEWMRSYKPEVELFRRERQVARRYRLPCAGGQAPHERQSACQWRPTDAAAAPARLRQLCRGREPPGRHDGRGDGGAGRIFARRDA